LEGENLNFLDENKLKTLQRFFHFGQTFRPKRFKTVSFGTFEWVWTERSM